MTAPPHPARPGWYLDELATIGRENLDAGHVARYDDKEDADAAAEVDRLRSVGLGAAATVVDLGAGTGQWTLAAVPVFGRVVAVDPSPVMRARLRAKAAAAGLAPEVVAGGFLTYRHEGAPPELVYSRYALHHLPDLWKALALRRIAALLPPGGWFRLWDVVYRFPLDEAEERIERWCAAAPETGPDGTWTRADLEEHVRDEHSTFSWLLEPMFDRAGFTVVEADHGDDGFSSRYLLRRR